MAYRGFMPLANRVLVQRAAAVTKSAGGIMLPESSLQKQNIATVLAVGEGALTEAGKVVPMTVAVGEKVLLPEFGGMEVELEGEKYLLFRDLDFLGKMEADA